MARKLIIGYDGSPNSRDALALGKDLARMLGCAPLAVLVLPYQRHLFESDDARARVEMLGEQVLAELRAEGGAVAARALAARSPAKALEELAATEGAAAIVVGASHRSAVGRVVLGSVGASLLSGARCPVAVAPHGYAGREPRAILRIGVGFDGGSDSRRAVKAAAQIAESANAGLEIVSVVAPPPVVYPAPYPTLDAGAYESAEEKELGDAVRAVVAGLPDSIGVESRMLRGDPAACLAKAAESHDLLVLGSRGYGPITRTLLGAVSRRLLATAPCPVIVLPHGQRGDALAGSEKESDDTAVILGRLS